MTEGIIIDGVNVAGCRHYDKTLKNEHVFNCYENCDLPVYCENKNCYYKRLKRLEQIVEVGNKQIELDAECIANYIKEVRRLKQENERLRQEIIDYRREFASILLWKDRKDIQPIAECLNVYKYRSALEEIRVIADDTFKVCDDDCGNARKIKLIVDRINEVLNANND